MGHWYLGKRKLELWRIPRHNFHAWLVTLNRLPSRDRLASYCLSVPSSCLLCNFEDESRNHKYLVCSYSWNLWYQFASRLGITPSSDWNQTLSDIYSLPGLPWRGKLQLIVWQGLIYALWKERNSHLHHNSYSQTRTISLSLDRMIRNKIHARFDIKPTATSNMHISSGLQVICLLLITSVPPLILY